MENQESSANVEVPFDVAKITADDINMEDIIITSTQSRDIYEVSQDALHILKYLPEDILREEPDFSSIKSNEAIQDYGLCGECDTPILTEDPPRSLILNGCGDMIHRTCARGTDKRGTLYCSCGKDDDSDPLLSSPDYDDGDLFEESCDKCSEVISKVPLSRLDVSVSTPVVLLPCKHKVHFECIGNKSKLCHQLMILKKKDIIFHLLSMKHPRKGRGMMTLSH